MKNILYLYPGLGDHEGILELLERRWKKKYNLKIVKSVQELLTNTASRLDLLIADHPTPSDISQIESWVDENKYLPVILTLSINSETLRKYVTTEREFLYVDILSLVSGVETILE